MRTSVLFALLPVVAAISSIPYDPTLVLGNLVRKERIELLQQLSGAKRTVDIAHDGYNALLQARVSLDMSLQELVELDVQDQGVLDEVNAKRDELNKKIATGLKDLVTKRMAYIDQEATITSQLQGIGSEPETPLDFTQSKLETMPISSDTMTIDVQYFRSEQNTEGSKSIVKSVGKWVSTSVSSFFHGSVAAKAKTDAETHMNSQYQNNELVGTIAIFVAATHKNAKYFSPTKFDALKLVAAWNELNSASKIDLPAKTEQHYKEWVAARGGKSEGDEMNVLTGVTYGSSFIGFIHLAKSSRTQNSEVMRASAQQANAEATYHNFMASITGAYGMSRKDASDLKSLFSTNEILSHVSVLSYGIMPSLASQNMETALKSFTEFSPDTADNKLVALANGQSTDVPDMDSESREAIRAGRIADADAKNVQAVLSGVAESDKANNQVIDMNSLMLALDDYIKTARDADGGVPINFFTSPISKKDVLREWFKAYRPELWNAAMRGMDPFEARKEADGNKQG